jgi:hypothetical protein
MWPDQSGEGTRRPTFERYCQRTAAVVCRSPQTDRKIPQRLAYSTIFQLVRNTTLGHGQSPRKTHCAFAESLLETFTQDKALAMSAVVSYLLACEASAKGALECVPNIT